MEWRIATGLLPRLLAEAAQSPQAEVCGLLLGAPSLVEEARACRNVAARPADSFEIDPVALLAAHRAERTGGPRLLGCYHSHPSGQPIPSVRDRAAAEPGRLWLILGGGEARLWLAGSGDFRACRLVESCHGG